MKRPNFLNKLKDEGKLGLVEPSEEICNSYLGKADNCPKSARVLYKNDLYENSIFLNDVRQINNKPVILHEQSNHLIPNLNVIGLA